ncbi:MAG: hypothetical protein AAB434_13260 [Planctomycetota bacterium]
MRPFYYSLLVILAFAGLAIVACNLSSREHAEVCLRCGRIQRTLTVIVLGTPFKKRVEVEVTAFTREWPGALQCPSPHAWQQTDYNWRSLYDDSSYSRMPAHVRRLLDDPKPILLLRRIDAERAEDLLTDLMREDGNQGGYYVRGNRMLRQPSSDGPTAALLERLREKPMTADELRLWDRENREPEPPVEK